jgi:hypothetical protein
MKVKAIYQSWPRLVAAHGIGYPMDTDPDRIEISARRLSLLERSGASRRTAHAAWRVRGVCSITGTSAYS